MSEIDLANSLFGSKRLEGSTHHSSTSTLTGTAVSDSADGKVKVVIDGDSSASMPDGSDGGSVIELATSPAVREGDSVLITAVGDTSKTMTVTSVVASGDRNRDQAVVSTLTEYATSQDPATAPTSGWSQEQPEWTEGNYIWMRQTVTYGSGEVEFMEPACITGNTGKGVKGDNAYVHIAYANSEDGKTDFSVDDPVGKSYIGQYSDNLEDDSTDPTKYSWTKIKGERGVSPTVTTEQTDTGATITITDAEGTKTATVTNGQDADIEAAEAATKAANTAASSATSAAGNATTAANKADTATTNANTATTNANNAAAAASKVNATVSGTTLTVTDNTGKITSVETKGEKGEKGEQGIQGEKGEQGDKGDDGTSVTVKSTSTQYASSTSGTATPSSWQGTIPTVAAGSYLWTKTTVVYSDGNSTSTYTVALQGKTGAQGAKGDTGAAGASKFTWIKYADSPTSGMSDSPDGKAYMGVAYNKDTATESTAYSDYSWSLIKGETGATGAKGDKGDTGATGATGAKGDTGATGNGIKSMAYAYKATTTQTQPAASEITATTIPTLSATNKYLWQKETVTFTSGSTQTNVALVGTYGDTGAKGDKGDTGAAGKGVASIVEQYYQSTSATSQTGGSWSGTYPGWVDGKYIWTRSVITYTDATTTTTTPVCVTGSKGGSGDQGTSITDVDVWYYQSTSATALSGGSWSTTAPTWANGKYIWTKTITTYSTGKTSESEAACITGQQGSTGATGKGVKSVAVTYQAGTSGTTVPTGTWSSSVPTVTKGQYLWTKTVTTYTDSATSTGYSVSYQPTNGTNGTSVTISSTSVTYQASTSGTTAPTGTWSTSVPTVSNGSYLWTKTVVTYSTGTSTTSYSVAYKGTDGTKGESVTKVAVTYGLSTSNASDGYSSVTSWTTDIPDWVSGKYIWQKSVTTIGTTAQSPVYALYGAFNSLASTVDGHTTTISQMGDTIKLKADSDTVVGNNMMRGTAQFSALTGGKWKDSAIRVSVTGTIGHAHDSSCPVPDSDVVTITATKAGYDEGFAQDVYPSVSKGQAYTMSCYVYASTAMTVALQPMSWSGITGDCRKEVSVGAGKWTKLTHMYTPTVDRESSSIGCVYIARATAAGQTLKVCGLKVEKGSKATDWCAANEELTTSAQLSVKQGEILSTVSSTYETLTDAATIKTTAETAASDASTAKATASTAASDASTAKSNAATAVTTANTASSTANTAKTTAETAASDASTAKTNASTALSTANTASSNASTALSTANVASSKITQTASRVGITFNDSGTATTGTLINADSTGIEVGYSKDGSSFASTHTKMGTDAFSIHDASHNELASFGTNKMQFNDSDGGNLFALRAYNKSTYLGSSTATHVGAELSSSSGDFQSVLGAYYMGGTNKDVPTPLDLGIGISRTNGVYT